MSPSRFLIALSLLGLALLMSACSDSSTGNHPTPETSALIPKVIATPSPNLN